MKKNIGIEEYIGKIIARAHYQKIIGSQKDRRSAFYQIKSSLPYPHLCQACDYLDKNINDRLKELLFGNPLPKKYADLGKCEFSFTTGELIKEINWALLAIRKYSYQINLFLTYKTIYEKNLLIGNYDEAQVYLEKIENEICCSLWTLENRFLILEFTNRSSISKDFLSEFNKENESESLTKSLAHYLNIRAEKTLSVNRFNEDLKAALSKIQGDRKQEHFDYYLFKLSFLNNLEFSKFVEIVAYDFQHSVIDRYLNLRKVLINLLTIAHKANITVEENIRSYVLNRINYLIRKINDPVLFKLKLAAGDKIFPTFEDQDKPIIEIIDNYTSGFYQEAEEGLKKLLLENPSQFDLYELYIKSLIYQKKPLYFTTDVKSIQNEILNEMYKIISVSGDPIEAGNNLLRIANNISGCILSYGLTNFVFHQTQGKTERNLLAKLSFNPANPILYEIYDSPELQTSYLEFLKNQFPNSITIDFLVSKLNNIDNIPSFAKRIPQVRYLTEFAKALQAKNRYEEASKIWENLINSNSDTAPIFEIAIRNLFQCYENLGLFDDCIKLYVDSFFTNQYIVDKIETKSLLQKIKENRFKVVKPIIELPIFYTIVNADENETHTAFEKFNLSQGICKPSELIKKFKSFESQKILFYLRFTCSPEILKHSIHISGTKEGLEERLSICQFLKKEDTENKEAYEDEIKNISNILIIQKGLLELDESKIYVNEQGIVSNELKDFEAIFQRFKTISGVADKNKILLLEKGKLITLDYSKEHTKAEKIEYSNNPVFDIYKELFEAIKNKFLYSKFGIVAYLSTRIRHGVLLGEIRPIFEKHKLITQKEGDTSTYRKNVYWENVYQNEPPIIIAKIQTLLNDFSYSVDGAIFDLIKKFLQVFDEEKSPDGWFNYSFSDSDLFWYSIAAIKTKDFSQFAKEVFEILWERTDVNLNEIRNKIQTKVANQFNELFDQLEQDLLSIMNIHTAQKLISEIKACSTETNSAIQRISSWFKRSGTHTSDFRLSDLIDIVLEYTNKTHPQKISLEKDLKFDCTIKGEYYSHFADLLRIFMENILKHSDEKIFFINAKICTKRFEKGILISIENEITNKLSVEALDAVYKEQILDISKLVNEKKSGYHKAHKILKSDLKNEGNNFWTLPDDTMENFKVSIYINLKEIAA